MRTTLTLGHINPLATHIICFLIGASCLFLNEDIEQLVSWKGVMISISEGKADGMEGQVFLATSSGNDSCLIYPDPVMLWKFQPKGAAILLPRQLESLNLFTQLIKGRFKVIKDAHGILPCSANHGRVTYG